jgi:hypothetical protein
MNMNWMPIKRSVYVCLSAALLLTCTSCICIRISVSPNDKCCGSGGGGPGGNSGGNVKPGGPFTTVPLQTVSGGGTNQICSTTVSGYYARFWTPQTPDSGIGKFQGYVKNDYTGLVIPNNGYVLEWYVNTLTLGCCTPLTGSTAEVICPVTPGTTYRFIAHFKTGYVPATGQTVSLYGTFVPSDF